MRHEIEQWARTAAALMLIAALVVLTIIVMTRDCNCSPVEPASNGVPFTPGVYEAGSPTQPPLVFDGAQVWDLAATTSTTPPTSTSMSQPAEKATG